MTLHVLKNTNLIHDEQSFVRGVPTSSNERWKYTDLGVFDRHPFVLQNCDIAVPKHIIDGYRLPDVESILLVLIDGRFEPAYSDLDKLPNDLFIGSMSAARQTHAEIIEQHAIRDVSAQYYPFAAFNTATPADGLFIHCPPQMKLSLPLHILSLATGHAGAMTHTQHLWIFGEGSDATLFQEYVSLRNETYFTNVVTTLSLESSSKIEVVKSQREGIKALHMENYFIRQNEDSEVAITAISSGAEFARDDIIVALEGAGSKCTTSGFYHTNRDGQYVDYHIDVRHAAPRTYSEMLYKGVADKKSRAVFNGSLCVEQGAQKINAVQANHNLLLSNQAEVYSKPELEIYADDVKCRHGATTGQIDQDALFYLQARGIDKNTAINILLQGFAEEVSRRISNSAIQKHVMQQVKFI